MPDKTDKAVIATSSVAGVLTVTSGAATVAGFTSSGIAAGSVAAGMQATIGNVVGGSAFAAAQSLGATGVFATLGAASGIGLGVCAVYGGYKLYKHMTKSPS
jgi:hypothetical protein